MSIEHHRDHVLQADVGNVPVVDDRADARGEPDDDLLDVVGVERTLPAEVLDRVERRLDRRADRPLLDVGVDDLVSLAQMLDEHRRVAFGRIHAKEVVVARKHIVHAIPPRADEQRRGDAVSRRHASEDEGLLDVVRVPAPDGVSRRLLRRVVEQPAHLLWGQSRYTSGRGCRAERARKRVRAAAALVSEVGPPSAIVSRGPTSYPSVTARRKCSPLMPSSSPSASAAGTIDAPGCDCEGPCESSVSSEWARTPLTSAASIGPVRMVEPTTVAEGRPACARASASAARPGGSSDPDTHRRERVEDVMLRLLDDVGWQRPILGRRHVVTERRHHRAGGLRPKPDWQRCADGQRHRAIIARRDRRKSSRGAI